ncbi:glycosyltransferase family 4 protein [Burkholderia vietnamiensis]|uniref:glycosyltransferase family 4 protein n=1 Tax=Burkholderia vietnamiensis TaxID=60552 RepID=UPI0007591F0C|nr:glycosyltransferase family 4 protein [Burkholderia vietnamiensis]KVF31511.1 glycosyl transferase [Burkholderia vietnamiensis]MBR8279949.1 glycosyltransferase family 4 protein [Burkholderia vietnamiensis]WHU91107.1 glycosyltransferase family 4 protein [Burkholderia vietnamiensis]HDR9000041.1 glycosyltransferase family 4 protein [Burkholderia vietnamiensis]HDR9031726.1 glycosyltransferase family 4 protein [Burkholderia vietnamiensis]
MLRSLYTLFRKAPPQRRPRTDGKLGVLIELSSFDKGGLEKVVLDSAIAFDRERFDVTIVTPGTVGHLGAVARNAGLRVVGLPTANPLVAYERLLAELNVDISMSHFSNTGYPLFERIGIPNITFIHNVYAFFSDEQARAFAENDRYVDRYVSVSKNATRFAVTNLGVSDAKIVTVPNGLILSEHEAREKQPAKLTREQLGLSDSDYVFANVASYNLHKGHYVMADAMRHLLARRRDVKILCVGNVIYPPHIEALRHYLAEHGLEGHILMPGYFPDVEDVHRIADAFILPSFIEGWSIAMNEAMFYRKPMILTDTGASAEVIEGDDIGILIPNEYGDTPNLNSKLLDELAYAPREYKIAPALADAMDKMASNAAQWRERGARGRDKIYANYNFSDIVTRYESIIEDVVRAHSR